MKLLNVIVCAALLAAVTVTAFGDNGTGTVKGSLVSNGQPNVNAKISVVYYAPAPVETIIYSDANGNFSAGGIPVGMTVSVVVYDSSQHAIGRGSATINSAGQVVTVTIDPVPVVIQGQG